ncbi:nicotinamide mononucleotide adenylyltransferase [Pseudopedobacter beijingensis]|uniref:Nicotinamide mononucleotide adenylyltransferase n=1 Tax=Pseudopedobacter beijingensis TaxID=1207056 RepID=A0ABW4IEV6_9SPHI
MSIEILDTKRKALTINLDGNVFGTFAEIGAGQEVARHFFTAGAAANTVAKTMSAYDMTFSNEIYGVEESGRYVSKSRLKKMLEYEFQLLQQRLKTEKYKHKTFFSFANTVTTINYAKTNDPHGWLGIKFQLAPGGEENQILFHVRLLDNDSTLQQNVLGILGVNLVYAAFYHYQNPRLMVESLTDNLAKGSVEIDLISVKGNAFKGLDDILANLYLIQKGFSPVAFFGADGKVYQAKDSMYKKHIMILRTRFKQKNLPDFGLFEQATDQYKVKKSISDYDLVGVVELTLNNLLNAFPEESEDFLNSVAQRTKEVLASGYPVIVTNFNRHNKLAKYLSMAKPLSVGITTSINNLKNIFLSEHYGEGYTDELLAYISDLFSRKVRLLVYPFKDSKTKEIFTTKNLPVSAESKPLYDFLLQNNYIIDVENVSFPD